MQPIGRVTLRDRVFQVSRASITKRGDSWCIDVETESEEFDGERWAPNLYHQGLHLVARDAESLQGQVTAWHIPSESTYPHPELGVMYVFGHHPVRNCTVSFGKFLSGRIEVEWEGECDVFWGGEFSESVPFRCNCSALVVAA